MLYSLKNLPESYVKEAVKTLDAAINKDIKMEKEEQAALKRQITATESKKEQLLDLLSNKSITQDLYNKKYTSLCNEQEKMKHRLESYDLIVRKSLITCKTLFLLVNRAYELFESSKTEEKRRLIKILFSKLEIDGKIVCFQRERLLRCCSQQPFIKSGWKKGQFPWQNLIINYELFLRHREEILIMKECLVLIKNLTENEMTI